MIPEILIAAMSLLGCAGCWAAVQKHRIVAEMQKDKLKHDLEVLKPTPEPPPPPVVEKPSPQQQALTALLERRSKLENHVTELRKRVCDYQEARFAQYRSDALQALQDARKEQRELVVEEAGLLQMMQGARARVETEQDLDIAETFEEEEEERDRREA